MEIFTPETSWFVLLLPPPSSPSLSPLLPHTPFPSLFPQVKFFKPSTSALFKNLYAYLLGLAQTSSPTAVSPQAKDDSDAIVAKLSLLAHDPKLWLEELHELFEDGWQPELVFIDAGLVTQLDGTNRRNFLDL